MPLNILYYGPAKDLYKDIEDSEHWHEEFLQKLKVDKTSIWSLMNHYVNIKYQEKE